MGSLLRCRSLWAILIAAQPVWAPADELRDRAAALFGTIEPATAEEIEAPAASLGRALFWDARLSADGKTACASCHSSADWGADARPHSLDARGQMTQRNAQSVWNAQAAPAGLRWIADRATGADQALGSITGSMGFDTREELIPLLREYGYAERMNEAFPATAEPVSAENYAQALQEYQRTLRTPAAFDRWLTGDDAALDSKALRGLGRFIDTGCAGCHGGALFGGASLQRFGLIEDFRPHTGSGPDDTGLMLRTGNDGDRDVFRVQPLRNVARTAPYFHDGSVATLGDAVAIMARVQLDVRLTPEAIGEIVAFLGALSGEPPAHYAPPELP